MKLPNASAAVILQQKVVDYLLSIMHRDGRHKAAFFMSFGFRLDAWEELAKALTEHARINEVASASSLFDFRVAGTSSNANYRVKTNLQP